MAGRTRLWNTLRFRFALWTAGLLLIVLTGFGAFVYWSMVDGLMESVDSALRLNASQALNMIDIEDGVVEIPDASVEGGDTTSREFMLRLISPDGQVLHEDGVFPALPLSDASLAAARAERAHFATLIDPASGEQVRVYTAPIMNRDRLVGIYQIGQTLTEVRETLSELLRILLISIPVLVVMAGGGGYLLAARALTPIDAITRTAQRISGEDLSARLHLPPTDDEVGRLAATFDGMLARLDDAFRRERRFTADASHELRTPLAAMQAIIEVTLERQRTSADYRQALEDVAEEAGRLRGLAESLLALARSDSQQPLAVEQIDVSALLADIVESLRPLAKDKELALTCEMAAGLRVSGDMDSLIRLFANLIGNAIKYTEHGSVAVSARLRENQVEVTIADTGISIAADDLPHIFERFYRVEKSRTSNGAGLGLAIAQDIVRAHGGMISVSSEAGTGTIFTVRLAMAQGA